MQDLFAKLFEFFGFNPLYAKDFSDLLRGFDITCTDYTDTPIYSTMGYIMVASVIVAYVLHYHVINSPTFNKWSSWWVMAIVIAIFNHLTAFLWTYNIVRTNEYCSQLNVDMGDCMGFGISVAFWSFILWGFITSFPFPRGFAGHNMTHTTFWKPKA